MFPAECHLALEGGYIIIYGVDVIDDAVLFGDGRDDDGIVFDFAGVEVASGAFAQCFEGGVFVLEPMEDVFWQGLLGVDLEVAAGLVSAERYAVDGRFAGSAAVHGHDDTSYRDEFGLRVFHGRFGDFYIGVLNEIPVYLLGPQPGDVALVVFRDVRLGGAATVDVEADLAEGGCDGLGFVFDVEQLVAESYQQLLALFDLLFDLFDFVVVSIEGFGDTLLFLIFREEHFDFVYLLGCEVFGAVAGGC